MEKVYILSSVRTPIGSFGGILSSQSATQLGAAAIKGALAKAGVEASDVEEVIMGNVISANLGQAPARQAAIFAGIGQDVPCTTINKVCASGTKAIMLAAQSIMLGNADVIVAGGMESMSNIPYYLPKARYGYKFGDGKLVDGLTKDGLTDVYSDKIMGICADQTATEYEISREAQDEYTINSYKRVAENTENGFFKNEIIPVEIAQRKGEPLIISEDEEFKKVKFEKIPSLRPVFSTNGTVTAANASTINDGASAAVLISETKMRKLGLLPQAEIIAFADAAREPEWFTIAPVLAAKKALEKSGLSLDEIDYFEVNEAFSVVPLAFNQLMGVDPAKVNVVGGSVAIGHPLGASGARIVTTLNNVLHQKSGNLGMAAICNGGGGASAIIIKREI
ncbi:acetyl-CoA C-acyltransferase [Flammeovirgaceae bacterium SG7u.111]|nr:acetyl-CoA C-acyltransferase [Flammeovirgaceae bacterium SG7u.132]WPO38517.1 acetyl-CoA C-acyltransferase [Flammeovirgaceae bacterium SG7u.111]